MPGENNAIPVIPEGAGTLLVGAAPVDAVTLANPVAAQLPLGADANQDTVNKDANTQVAPLNQEALAPYHSEFAETGALTEESITKLAKESGFSEETIKQHVKMSQVTVQNQRVEFLKGVGGEEGYGKMQAWAAENIPAEQKPSLNAMLNSNDLSQMAIARDHIHNAYKAAVGSNVPQAPNLLSPDRGAPSAPLKYKSLKEQSAAINDPRYKLSPEYRAEVATRMM